MKTLYIMRHADASFNAETDFKRKLTLKGINEAELTAKKLAENIDMIDYCVCSGATRTIETLNIISNQIKFREVDISEMIYETNKEVLLSSIEAFKEQYHSAIIIAHNPSVSNLLYYLTGSNFNFSTSNIVEIKFEFNSWKLISNQTGIITNTYYSK